jgi:hypothetical protein
MVLKLVLQETTGGVLYDIDHWIGKNRRSTMSSGYCKSALHSFDYVYPFTVNQIFTLSMGYQ